MSSVLIYNVENTKNKEKKENTEWTKLFVHYIFVQYKFVFIWFNNKHS